MNQAHQLGTILLMLTKKNNSSIIVSYLFSPLTPRVDIFVRGQFRKVVAEMNAHFPNIYLDPK